MRRIIKAFIILFRQGPKALFRRIKYESLKRIQYKHYIRIHKKLDDRDDTKRDKIRAFRYRPKVSIIVPVYNTGEKWLSLCIKSVLNQVYDNWELCIADGCSKKPYIRKILEKYSAQDSRIKIKFLTENKGIAGNSNEALSIITGEFIGLLDHDDELSSDALYEVVKLLNEKPDTDFIYTDEDKITVRGKRIEPYFKPDWSPNTLYSCNYITHFSVIRKDILDRLGGFREGYDGSQDYDLFLRITEITSNIAHIPKILYHWRMIPHSAASSSNAKPYATVSAKRAIKDSLDRKKINADVFDGTFTGFYRVKYKVMGSPKVSIIIPAIDKVSTLQRCIKSILSKTLYDNYEIIVVDSQSRESEIFNYYKEIESNQKIRIIKYDRSFNYSKIGNYAVSLIDSEYIVFLDNNTEIISQEWLTAMLEHIQRKEIAVAGASVCYPDQRIYHAGIIVGINGFAGYAYRYFFNEGIGYPGRTKIIHNLSAVSGICMMIKKSAFKDVGGFDELFRVALSDIDLCLKVRERSYLIVYTPYTKLYYYEYANKDHQDIIEKHMEFKKDIEYFRTKWKDVIDRGDPYYNTNLTLEREDFSMKL
jgi:glycosyltransferase involved in cell wall biosynthesis